MTLDTMTDSTREGPRAFKARATRWDTRRKCFAESITATGKTRREAERKALALLRAGLAGKN
jgi:hypothetical protein